MRSKFFVTALSAVLLLTGAGCISFGKQQTGPVGVFKSNDKGESWEQANTFPTVEGVKSLASVPVYRLHTDPTDPDTLYLASRGMGLYYTTNRGASWEKVEALKDSFVYGFSIDPTDRCTIFVSAGSTIYKSTDCTRTWVSMYTEQSGDRVVALAVDYVNSDVVYAALFGGSILKSTDGGTSWRVIKAFKGNIQYMVADPLSPGRIYVARALTGLSKTEDGGATWTSLGDGIQGFNDGLVFYRLILHPTKKDALYWLSRYGILHSEDSGKTWAEYKLLTSQGTVNIYSFAVNPSNDQEMYYVGTLFTEAGTRSTFYKSSDGGNTWLTKKLPTNTVPVTMRMHPLDNNILFMAFTVPDKK